MVACLNIPSYDNPNRLAAFREGLFNASIAPKENLNRYPIPLIVKSTFHYDLGLLIAR